MLSAEEVKTAAGLSPATGGDETASPCRECFGFAVFPFNKTPRRNKRIVQVFQAAKKQKP
jgi:hypothetical protein